MTLRLGGPGYYSPMPDMDDLEQDAKKEAESHPQDVKKGEEEAAQEAEKELGKG